MVTRASPALAKKPEPSHSERAPTVQAEPVWLRQAPLLPVAGFATAGVALDRLVGLTPAIIVAWLAGAFLAAWIWRKRALPALAALWVATMGLGAGRHYLHRHPPANDVVHVATSEGTLVRIKGVILDGLAPAEQTRPDPLRSRNALVRASGMIDVAALWQDDGWRPASGRIRLTAADSLDFVHVGDEIVFTGMLFLPEGPGNPGERDGLAAARDQGISGAVRLDSGAAVVVQRSTSPWNVWTWVWRLRTHAADVLAAHLSPEHVGIARALLLGEQRALVPEAMEAYRRTGVMHVLAISGQHLAILCMAFSFRFFGKLPYPAVQLVGLSRRRVIWLIMAFVAAYVLVTGCQPPILRAAIMVIAWCVATALRRGTQVVNSLALAWLVLVIVNPTEMFQVGCQLSFLGTLALFRASEWLRALAPEYPRGADPLEVVIWESRPWWLRLGRYASRRAFSLFFCGLVVWLLAWPLLASRFHLVSPVACVLGPMLIVLVAVALHGCFLLMTAAPLSDGLASVVGSLLDLCFGACSWCVRVANSVPGGHWYVADVPEWWLWVWCAGVAAVLLWPGSWAWRRYLVLVAIGWTCILLILPSHGPVPGELRCAFLDVGHGACAVLEMPDGRIVLYDAGSMAGPEIATRRIAPYLWRRGITRIDEILLSHADQDHFNALPALLHRFAVGQVSLTPSFEQKREPGVHVVVAALRELGVPTRTIHARQELAAGDVAMTLLHPPPRGPDGAENARSMVILVTYQGRNVLLTGDLASPGLEGVLRERLPSPIDVVLAPHHGSAASNTDRFARWANAGLAISSEGRLRGERADPYAAVGTAYWRTSVEGAITIRIAHGRVSAEGFRTGRRWSGK